MSILTSDFLALKNYSEAENVDCFRAVLSSSESAGLKDNLSRLNTHLFEAGLALSDLLSKLGDKPDFDLVDRLMLSSIADGIFERKEYWAERNQSR